MNTIIYELHLQFLEACYESLFVDREPFEIRSFVYGKLVEAHWAIEYARNRGFIIVKAIRNPYDLCVTVMSTEAQSLVKEIK